MMDILLLSWLNPLSEKRRRPRVLLTFFAYLTLAERRVLGRFQIRRGPNRVGPFGLFQPIADGIKALTKEELVPEAADKAVFVMGPAISVFAVLCLFAVMPFGGTVHMSRPRRKAA